MKGQKKKQTIAPLIPDHLFKEMPREIEKLKTFFTFCEHIGKEGATVLREIAILRLRHKMLLRHFNLTSAQEEKIYKEQGKIHEKELNELEVHLKQLKKT